MPARLANVKNSQSAAVVCCPNVPRSPIISNNLYSLGLLYLAESCARAGIACEQLDAYFLNLGAAETVLRLLAVKAPTAYGFMINSEEMLSSAMDIVQELKSRCGQRPIPPVVLGGMYATLRYREILARHPEVDFVVLGEGESTFVELIAALRKGAATGGIQGLAWREQGKACAGAPRTLPDSLDAYGCYDLSRIPSPDQSGAWTISSSRGCSGSCSFCLVGLNFSGKAAWRGHSATWIVGQMRTLALKHGARRVLFVDDEFIGCPASLSRAEELAERLARLRLPLKYSIMCRPDTVIRNTRLVRRLRDSGLDTVFLGVETFNPRILKRLNKGFTPEAAKAAITFLESLGMIVQCGNIVFTPWMTSGSLTRDLKLFREQVERGANTVFFSLNGIDIFGPTALGRACGARTGSWQLRWSGADKRMHSVYRLWQEIERVIFFPALGGLAGKQPGIRKELCLWQLDTAMDIIAGVKAGQRGLRRRLMFGAYLRACSLVTRHGGEKALKRFTSLNRSASAKATEREICFERHY